MTFKTTSGDQKLLENNLQFWISCTIGPAGGAGDWFWFTNPMLQDSSSPWNLLSQLGERARLYGSVLETIVVTRSAMLGPTLVRAQPGGVGGGSIKCSRGSLVLWRVVWEVWGPRRWCARSRTGTAGRGGQARSRSSRQLNPSASALTNASLRRALLDSWYWS